MDADDAYHVLAGEEPGSRAEALDTLKAETAEMLAAWGELPPILARLRANGLSEPDIDEIVESLSTLAPPQPPTSRQTS